MQAVGDHGRLGVIVGGTVTPFRAIHGWKREFLRQPARTHDGLQTGGTGVQVAPVIRHGQPGEGCRRQQLAIPGSGYGFISQVNQQLFKAGIVAHQHHPLRLWRTVGKGLQQFSPRRRVDGFILAYVL